MKRSAPTRFFFFFFFFQFYRFTSFLFRFFNFYYHFFSFGCLCIRQVSSTYAVLFFLFFPSSPLLFFPISFPYNMFCFMSVNVGNLCDVCVYVGCGGARIGVNSVFFIFCLPFFSLQTGFLLILSLFSLGIYSALHYTYIYIPRT